MTNILPSNKDPFLINPRGAKVRVPLARVKGLLKQGYQRANKQWGRNETLKTIQSPKIKSTAKKKFTVEEI